MSEQTPQKVWFITGASTGFGRIMAERLLASGHKVIATARKPDQIDKLAVHYKDTCLVAQLDVTKKASIDAAVSAALEKFGHVDVLVNNAGYGIAGGVEETTEDEFMPVFDTNVFGLIRVTRAFLPQFRKQRRIARNIFQPSPRLKRRPAEPPFMKIFRAMFNSLTVAHPASKSPRKLGVPAALHQA